MTKDDTCWHEHRCDICGASWGADDDDRLLLALLAAIREYPVEQRMEAMGMERRSVPRSEFGSSDSIVTWVEAG